MTFVVAQRFSGVMSVRGGKLMRAGRRLVDKFENRHSWTPQERANAYVSRMPIAVVTASMGGHPPLNTRTGR